MKWEQFYDLWCEAARLMRSKIWITDEIVSRGFICLNVSMSWYKLKDTPCSFAIKWQGGLSHSTQINVLDVWGYSGNILMTQNIPLNRLLLIFRQIIYLKVMAEVFILLKKMEILRSIFQTFSQVNLQQSHNFFSLIERSILYWKKKLKKKTKHLFQIYYFLFSVSILTFVQRY